MHDTFNPRSLLDKFSTIIPSFRVARNPRTVASPVIETIDEKTFQYKFVTTDLMGTFNWKLEFDWGPVTDEQLEMMEHAWAPYK